MTFVHKPGYVQLFMSFFIYGFENFLYWRCFVLFSLFASIFMSVEEVFSYSCRLISRALIFCSDIRVWLEQISFETRKKRLQPALEALVINGSLGQIRITACPLMGTLTLIADKGDGLALIPNNYFPTICLLTDFRYFSKEPLVQKHYFPELNSPGMIKKPFACTFIQKISEIPESATLPDSRGSFFLGHVFTRPTKNFKTKISSFNCELKVCSHSLQAACVFLG